MGLHVYPGNPAHLLYGVKFLHLPLYRGDGDCAVEGLLSTQNEKEEKAKGGKKRTADGHEQNAGKKKIDEARAWRIKRNEELRRKK